ncbi:MAG TPA: PKD domain-containing protein, partial [Thermodesulfobacteriota bacterium]|nr:PKD domain-containing protein [Thermodesulfobacteriota bacterium]
MAGHPEKKVLRHIYLLGAIIALFFFFGACAGDLHAQWGVIQVNPSPVIVPPGGHGTATVTWTVSGFPYGQVYVVVNGGAEQLLAATTSGQATPDWFYAGSTYVFRLYGSVVPYSRGNLLAQTYVSVQEDNSNAPPKAPSLNGPVSGATEATYSYSAASSDPNGDSLQYGWDWNGDSVVDEWSEVLPSGTSITRGHSWKTSGAYTVRVKAKDAKGAEGAWSQALLVNIGSAQPSGAVNASPNPVVLPAGTSQGTTTVSWSSSNTPYVQLWVSSKYIPDVELDQRLSGSMTADWIVVGDTYTFKLYASESPYPAPRGQLLASVTVTARQGNNPPNPPAIPNGPASGAPGASYSYSTAASDPDGDAVQYGWDWNGDLLVDE